MKVQQFKFVATLVTLFYQTTMYAQQPNGVIDGIHEMVEKREYHVRMSDGVELSTDVFRPVLQDDLAFSNISFNIPIIGNVTAPKIKLADRGVQYMLYPNQSDPRKLPIIFTRTPYGKTDPQGQIEALLGYAGVLQDTRGRYRSGGVFLPVFSDGWKKTDYITNIGHTLDKTETFEANKHEDGLESLQYLLYGLKYDANGDGVVSPTEPLLSNGSIGMFGASAHAITQYQLAAASKVNTAEPGLKCLVPIVASCEFYNTLATPNGVFRERMVDGWLRGQIERYGQYKPNELDGSIYNNVHSLGDYGSEIEFPKQAAEKAIDFWSTLNHAHYPNNPLRAAVDVSKAMLDSNGNGSVTGTVSRYTNMDLPMYHLSGWWDIFVDGQIMTYQNLRKHLTKHRGHQKLVIGPWAHYTIGGRATGDMRITPDGKDHRYPENVNDIIGAALDELDTDNLASLASSEALRWYRSFLGAPTVVFPPSNEWQTLVSVLGNDLSIRVPADTFRLSYEDFFNFINGTGPLSNIPVNIKGVPLLGENTIIPITIPTTGQSVLGDDSGIRLNPAQTVQWDGDKPGGVPNVRLYVVGPVADGVPGNEKIGNYWYHADTFPLPNLATQKLYFHADGRLDDTPPTTAEGARTYLADPDNPVITHGGPNLIEETPAIPGVPQRTSMGQMDLADPLYTTFTNNRPRFSFQNDSISDILHFSTATLKDTFSIAGFSTVTLYVKSTPQSTIAADSTNCDFVVRVVDVYPDGRELYVFEGAVNARAREYARSIADNAENENAAWSNIVSGQLYEYRFRTLPIAYTFGKGHKVKVLISSSNYPRYQSCPNVPLMPGEFYRRRPYENISYNYYGTELYPRKALQTLEFSDIYAANIEFPLLGRRLAVSRSETAPSLTTGFTMYPNPTEASVSFVAEQNGPYQLVITDIVGKVVHQAQFENTYLADVSTLPKGMYAVQIQHLRTNKQFTRKLMVR